jgi:hypothetical protein
MIHDSNLFFFLVLRRVKYRVAAGSKLVLGHGDGGQAIRVGGDS